MENENEPIANATQESLNQQAPTQTPDQAPVPSSEQLPTAEDSATESDTTGTESAAQSKPSKKKLSKKAKIWISIGVAVASLAVGWLTYAAIASNIEDKCNQFNNYCRGVFPFIKERNDTSSGDNTTHTTNNNGSSTKIVRPEKPIIYLYPESVTEVSVTLGHPEKLTASYPQYENGWHVLAEPSGTLTDLDTGRELYSLYWEGDQGNYEITNEGFVVKGSEVAGFLEEKLPLLGLNAKESEEFIIYWLPILQENEYNYIRFATSEEIEDYMPLTITPTPDTVIRVLMITKPLDTPITLAPQTFPDTPTRTGFTVVEWGGSR